MRMKEFYDWNDLDYFYDNVRMNNLSWKNATTWLDMQTRVRFVTGIDTRPDIVGYTLEYLIQKGIE